MHKEFSKYKKDKQFSLKTGQSVELVITRKGKQNGIIRYFEKYATSLSVWDCKLKQP